MELLLNCLKCGQKKVRKDERIDPPNYKWRCRNCGSGWKYTFLLIDGPRILNNRQQKIIEIIDNEIIYI